MPYYPGLGPDIINHTGVNQTITGVVILGSTINSQLPFSEIVKVRYSDLDAQGHLYFANYLVFGDEVLGAYMEQLGLSIMDPLSAPCLIFTVNMPSIKQALFHRQQSPRQLLLSLQISFFCTRNRDDRHNLQICLPNTRNLSHK